MGRPFTFTSAIGLEQVHKARNMALRKNSFSNALKPPLNHWSTTGRPPLPIKRLTPVELKERQEKSLCFKCNDKYGTWYCCKKLFMIEAYLEEDEDRDVMHDEEEDDTPDISLHAITSKGTLETMKIYGRIQ
jgi:hypothetical protein